MIVGGKGSATLIVGAGLVGANYAKRLLNSGRNIIATVRDLERKRGRLTNETLREAVQIAGRFDSARRNSPKLDEFMQGYETAEGILTKKIVGYLAAFPIASQMRKEGHF